MKTKVHAIAGVIGFVSILAFWSSTVVSELLGSYETVAAVKTMILRGMFILLPAMIVVGASGMNLGRKRKDILAAKKKKRMPIIAANGAVILLPAAFFLQSKAVAGEFDTLFYAVQVLELIAGAANLTMMGQNIREGRLMAKRRNQLTS